MMRVLFLYAVVDLYFLHFRYYDDYDENDEDDNHDADDTYTKFYSVIYYYYCYYNLHRDTFRNFSNEGISQFSHSFDRVVEWF